MSPSRMRAGVLGIEHIQVIELFGALRTIFEHRAHGRVAIDVRIFALDIGLRRILECDILQNVHQARLGLARTAALCAVEDIRLGRSWHTPR